MESRTVVRVCTVAAFVGIVGLQYAAGAQNGSMPPGNVKALNTMMGGVSGYEFTFLPGGDEGARTTSEGGTDILHVDILQFPDLIQRIDVTNRADPPDPDLPHLRLLLLPAVKEGDKSHLEIHIFTDDVRSKYDGEVEIFLNDGKTAVPGELLPAV